MATVRTEFTLDTSELKTLAKDLRRIAPDLARDLRTGLKRAAEPVRLDAARRAWAGSSKIPPTVRITTSGTTVKVKAGSAELAIAGLFELGNKGNKVSPASFRHPVFGNREVWRPQKTHPYLAQALAARQGQFVEGFMRIVSDVMARVNLPTS